MKYLKLSRYNGVWHFALQNIALLVFFYVAMNWAQELIDPENKVEAGIGLSIVTAMWIVPIAFYILTIREIKSLIKDS